MISLEPEILELRAAGLLDESAAARLIAAERRDIVSIYPGLRFLTWSGVMLVVTGVGTLVSKNLDRVGPIALAAAIGLASAACYSYAWWKRARTASLVDDFVLLLGSLLLSADIGYLEHNFHLFGPQWPRHFLVLAAIHGIVAYLFDSRMVLSLSITALAAWLGIERRIETLFDSTTDTAIRAFVCSALVVAWRQVDRRRRASRSFTAVFDHFATNLAFWGALILLGDDSTRLFGTVLGVALAVASAMHAFRWREEMFLIYAWVYGTIAVDAFALSHLDGGVTVLFYLVASTAAAIVGFFVSHARFRTISEGAAA
jgi:hypothetical protein